MADFEGRLEYEQEFFMGFFERCGVSAETARTVTDLPAAFVRYAPDVPTARELTAGDVVTVDGAELSVDDVDGHASGEIIFSFDAVGERRAIVGDNVLGHITPNPLLQPPAAGDGQRPRVLPAYNDSLARLRGAGHDQFLTGHGDRIDDPAGRIDEILEAHEQRTARVRELLDGPTVPADIMHGLFDDLPVTETFSGLSEAVGHLDVLEARGEVTQLRSGDVIVYEAVE
jgi:glyoxylase-like metal-dependent hydrolase (beta-lactamase superfamily II)